MRKSIIHGLKKAAAVVTAGLILSVFVFTGTGAYALTDGEQKLPVYGLEHEEDAVLIMIDKNRPLDELNRELTVVKSIKKTTVTEEDVYCGMVRLELNEGFTVPEAVVELRQLSCVTFAQPNYIYRALDNGDDADTEDMEGAEEDDEPVLGPDENGDWFPLEHAWEEPPINDPKIRAQWQLDYVQAYEAWEIVKAEDAKTEDGKPAVTVAVLDVGFMIDHEDLEGNVLAVYDVITESSDREAMLGSDAGHGTHASGIVSAKTNNGIGMSGISYNAGLVLVQCTTEDGGATSFNMLKGYSWILDHKDEYNVKVINISIGVSNEIEDLFEGEFDDVDRAYMASVQEAYEDGILTTFAAGNDADVMEGAYYNWPSDWAACALAVIGLTMDWDEEGNVSFYRLDFSNYNLPGQITKDIAAPGQTIGSTYYAYDYEDPTVYRFQDGTSMAAPVVAGVAALVYAVNPDFSTDQVVDILLSSAVDLGPEGFDDNFGFGAVNALNAVTYAKNGYYFYGNHSLLKGENVILFPAASGNYTWTSSDESIATVDNGIVSGLKAGVAMITAEDQDTGVKIVREMVVGDVSFSGKFTLKEGEESVLTVNAYPDRGYYWEITSDAWNILELTDLDVDYIKDPRSIKMKGVQAGKATVTISCLGMERTFEVTVKAPTPVYVWVLIGAAGLAVLGLLVYFVIIRPKRNDSK